MCESVDVSWMVYIDDSVSISPSERNYCVVECTVSRIVVLRVLSAWIPCFCQKAAFWIPPLRYFGVKNYI